jgi:hypothetical protein
VIRKFELQAPNYKAPSYKAPISKKQIPISTFVPSTDHKSAPAGDLIFLFTAYSKLPTANHKKTGVPKMD